MVPPLSIGALGFQRAHVDCFGVPCGVDKEFSSADVLEDPMMARMQVEYLTPQLINRVVEGEQEPRAPRLHRS